MQLLKTFNFRNNTNYTYFLYGGLEYYHGTEDSRISVDIYSDDENEFIEAILKGNLTRVINPNL